MNIFISLLTGFTVGLIFSILNLPIPAPPTIQGIAWIIWIFIWYIIVKWI